MNSSLHNLSGKIELPKHLSSWQVTSTRLWGSKEDSTIEVYYVTNKTSAEERSGAYVRWMVPDAKLLRRLQHYRKVLETLKGQYSIVSLSAVER